MFVTLFIAEHFRRLSVHLSSTSKDWKKWPDNNSVISEPNENDFTNGSSPLPCSTQNPSIANITDSSILVVDETALSPIPNNAEPTRLCRRLQLIWWLTASDSSQLATAYSHVTTDSHGKADGADMNVVSDADSVDLVDDTMDTFDKSDAQIPHEAPNMNNHDITANALLGDVSSFHGDNCTCCHHPDSDDMIQCANCKKWLHYVCTMLPSYQLWVFTSTCRTFECSACVQVPEDFQNKFHVCLTNQETQTESDTSSELASTATQTYAELSSSDIRVAITQNFKKLEASMVDCLRGFRGDIDYQELSHTKEALNEQCKKINDLSRYLAAAQKALRESEQRYLLNNICDGSCNSSVSRGNVIETKNSLIDSFHRCGRRYRLVANQQGSYDNCARCYMFLNIKRNIFQSMLCSPALWYFDTSVTYPQWFRRVNFFVIPPRFV